MSFNKSFLFIFIIVLLFSIASVVAIDANETTSFNKTQKTFTDLNQDINGNDDVVIQLDYNYTYSENQDASLNDGVEINRSLTVDGRGHTIDANNQSGIFKVNAGGVIFKNIIFKNARSLCGSAVHGNSTAINCTFINNCALADGGAVYGVEALNSTFENNYAIHGGAMFGGAALNCTFNRNSALQGGAIFGYNLVNSTICECNFLFNKARGIYASGGAIYLENSDINLTDSVFNNNSADEGGAVCALNSDLIISNCEFYNNLAVWYGGAVFSDSALNINNSRLYKNNAGYKGGAIHETYSFLTENCALNINNSYIYENSAEYGGAIHSSNLNHVKIFNSELYANSASFGAVISRFSNNTVVISNSKCYGNVAVNGSILYSLSGNEITFINDKLNDNRAYCGALTYAICARVQNTIPEYIVSFIDCNLSDNEAEMALIYSGFGGVLLENSSITYHNSLYNVPVVYKVLEGNVYDKSNWWGVFNPDLDKLIVFNYIGNTVCSNSTENREDEGCSSTVIQIDDETSLLTFRRDSDFQLCINIIKQDKGVFQYKADSSFFWHVYITDEGWMFGNGGGDTPFSCERYEAFAKMIVVKNYIDEDMLNLIFELKSVESRGHFLIKSPNGNYAVVSPVRNESRSVLLQGVLKAGEYIISPNDYNYYKTGNISEFNLTDYVLISRYLAAIDEYSPLRTDDFTYFYQTNLDYYLKQKYIDIYVSNDDGSLANKSDASGYFNDILINDRYIFGENVPRIMDGMYLGKFVISSEIIPIKTSISTSDISTVYNYGKYLIATLKDSYGNVLKNVEISISINGKTYFKNTDGNGEVRLYVDLPSKVYGAVISFAGSSYYVKSTANSKILVKKATPKLTAKSKTFKRKVKTKKFRIALKNNRNKAMKKVKVTLKVKGRIY